MVACPRCGGTSQRLLSPGFVECTSDVLQGVAPVPGGERPIYATCGNQFWISAPAAGAPSCSCGQFAIGHCVVCGAARCGRHGVSQGDRFLCPSHLQEEAANAQAEAGAALAAAGAPLRDWLLAIRAPEERFLTACLHFGSESVKRGASDFNPTRIEWTAADLLGDAFPELDRSATTRFFTPFFGTVLSESGLPIGPERLLGWVRARGTSPFASASSLTLHDCRAMARSLDLEPPQAHLLANWNAAAGRIYKLHKGSITGSPIAETLRSHPMPPPRAAETTKVALEQAPAAATQLTTDQRIEAALRELKRRGIAPTPRSVPGRYHLSLVAKGFGRVGEDVKVAVEPAYPVGSCTWSQPGPRGTDRYENLPTGITPSRRIVPMTHATSGDDVEMLYARWKRGADNSSGLSAGVTLYEESIAAALERLAGIGEHAGR
jgi:hypothetical protein